jgi:LAO/AO transport system kinase
VKTEKTASELFVGFNNKDPRILARLITLSENKDDLACEVLAQLYASIGQAKVLGITGPPGAGKSTLTNAFVQRIRKSKKSVAVIAVDPVSPFSGGALLGDRIRLVDHFNDPQVFIRSLSTRGKLGGLSLATREVVHLLDAFGYDYIIIETVGVGQSEVDVHKIADATLIVLVPEWGDSIQTIKSGLLEVGDIFAVNKSDRDGADTLLSALRNSLQIAQRESTPLLLTNHSDAHLLDVLFQSIENFFLQNTTLITERRKNGAVETATELLEAFVAKEARGWVEKHTSGGKNPYAFFTKFLKDSPPGSLFNK